MFMLLPLLMTGAPPVVFDNQVEDKNHYDKQTGQWMGDYPNCHIHDDALSLGLIHFFQRERASTISDFGCGEGKYVMQLRALGGFPRVTGVDGNPETQRISGGRCSVANLAFPMDLGVSDWIMAIEVVEHIPAEHERQVLTNIVSHARCGIVLSWAGLEQKQPNHPNCKSQDSVVRLMTEKYGLTYDKRASTWLKREATLWWLQNNVLVFRKKLEKVGTDGGTNPYRTGIGGSNELYINSLSGHCRSGNATSTYPV